MNTVKDPRKKYAQKNPITNKNTNRAHDASRESVSRRSFLRKGLVGASTVAVVGLSARKAEAKNGLTPGDAALLRFPAALEILEADFWIQYNELGGVQDAEVPGGTGILAYTNAL